MTRADLGEIKVKARDKRFSLIYEVARLAIVLKDAQEYVIRPAVCHLVLRKVIENYELKLILMQLDPTQIPVAAARAVLKGLYTNPAYLPDVLNQICHGIYMAVRHLEAVCLTCLEHAGNLEQQVRLEAKAARDSIMRSRLRQHESKIKIEVNALKMEQMKKRSGSSEEKAMPTGRTAQAKESTKRVASQISTCDSKKRHSISIFLNEQPEAMVKQYREKVYDTNQRKQEEGKNSILGDVQERAQAKKNVMKLSPLS